LDFEDDLIIDTLYLFENSEINDIVLLFEIAWHLDGGLYDGLIDDMTYKILSPNPSIDSVTLEECNIGDNYEIISSNGNLAKKGIINNDNCIISISELPTGTYYIKINSDVYKFVKVEN